MPADQLVHLGYASELSHTDVPLTVPFGGQAVEEVLAGPEDDSDRHRVVLAGRLLVSPSPIGWADNQAVDFNTRRIHGVCTVDSFWGVSAFRVTGTLRISDSGKTQEKIQIDLTAERVSGFDAGGWTLSFESDQPDETSAFLGGTASYHDVINTSLLLPMEIEGFARGQQTEMRFRAIGDGFYYASFLAAGESLGGAEG